VRNKSVASWQLVVVMDFVKRHDTTDTADFCPRQLVTDLLRTCYGETGVLDFGLYQLLSTQTVTTSSIGYSGVFVNKNTSSIINGPAFFTLVDGPAESGSPFFLSSIFYVLTLPQIWSCIFRSCIFHFQTFRGLL